MLFRSLIVFFPGFFLRRLHIMLTQCQSKTINIPNLAPIGRQMLLTIMAVHYRRRDIDFLAFERVFLLVKMGFAW